MKRAINMTKLRKQFMQVIKTLSNQNQIAGQIFA